MDCYDSQMDVFLERPAYFQSPFHRGMDCYSDEQKKKICEYTFSPLFIGAWTATTGTDATVPAASGFQSPFHRGMDCYGI